MAFLEKYLFTKKSQIPKAGLGLFTKIEIKKGACIVEYKGRLEKWKLIKHEDGHNGYLLRVNTRWAINALPYKKALGRFANDAQGINKEVNLTNNAEYLLEGMKCFIYAKKNIGAGEEILAGYGREYWNLVKHIAKNPRK